mmetsp:Transcript_35313/g.82458  ORF Transcript_35313/g.82458 Transcript_35313/m.82458 type:complete len:502 (-) Transcript_35313:96-1601(-)|eukprot:CAMPEP_0178376452 /NCGR_PEP_ID=MMETSP0689_2-20121128/3411_1 /TAXON_ID=160604 /ORGANISM="Amphidinium massartii, Strain CS-259" /LENGTH=501 /DNA_ID=CAMNT_0019996477 /DNA_START=53 /DNA_END=1558 /DNA_ORIENTATION=+
MDNTTSRHVGSKALRRDTRQTGAAVHDVYRQGGSGDDDGSPREDDSLETYCQIGTLIERQRTATITSWEEAQRRPVRDANAGNPRAVPEPDLSMEVEDWLKRTLRRHEALCRRELAAWLKMSLTQQDEAMMSVRVRTNHADAAVLDMICILRSFDPIISVEDLAEIIHGVIHSATISGRLGESFRASLQERVPLDRGRWMSKDIEKHLTLQRGGLQRLRTRISYAIRDASVPVVMLCGGGASVVVGALSGTVGLALGAMAGTASGVVLAPFTLGLSLPAGAVLGGGMGATLGTCAGASAGFIGGSLSSGVAFAYRVELQAGVILLRRKALNSVKKTTARAAAAAEHAKIQSLERVKNATAQVSESITSAAETTAHRVHEMMDQTQQGIVRAGVTLLSHMAQPPVSWAAGAGLALGTGAGATGLLAGGAAGAALGVVPAIFTFGLSIPVGGILGGGAGLCTGFVTGGIAGIFGGRAAGQCYVEHFGKSTLNSYLLGGTGGTL